ncbi:MAG: ABC transporter permease [Rhodospirillales bacterium]|nr:ABC transporter permease [Rhodospirillales bacterium]
MAARDHTRIILFSWQRVGALILRHLYVLRSSWPRILELAYWPVMQMVLWGFITTFFLQHSSWVAQAAGVLVSAVLLWDVLFRANLGVAIPFLEEVWSRNLGQLFISPLRPSEFIASLLIISVLRTTVAIMPAALLSFPLYDVWVFSLGLPLVAFYANLLIMGAAVGLAVSAIVLRHGVGAENLAWFAIFVVAPFSGIYYPVSTLPVWLQPVAWAMPSSYVFEGMRAVLFRNEFPVDLFVWSVALNAVYIVFASVFFLYMFRVARIRGLLLQQGE